MSGQWMFARRPRWIASHLFVAGLVLIFLWAGFWQLDRLSQRQAENDVIEARAAEAPISVAEALASFPDQLDYRSISDEGRYLDGEAVRIANRSQDGLGGDWVVAVFETADGQLLLVNRGFANRDVAAGAPPVGSGPIQGWLRASQTKDGFFGAVDTGEGRAPRLDVETLAERLDLDQPLAPAWLQLEDPSASGAPQPVPLPTIDEGNHFSYAMQWFTFAALSTLIYSLFLRKRAGTNPIEPVEDGC